MPTSNIQASFEIPGTLSFQRHGALEKAVITTDSCVGEVFLQGAHITHWQPHGEEPVLFLSENSAFLPGKAIRGGIPIIFPWFGARTPNKHSSRTDGPAHGFARTQTWQVTGATASGENLVLAFQLLPNDESAALGFENFSLNYEVSMGKTLELKLTCTNTGQTSQHIDREAGPILFEEALHTYFAASDIDNVSVSGLANTEYLDKTDDMKRKRQEEKLLKLSGETDRPYLNTSATVTLLDQGFQRRIKIEKEQSLTTVVWNPGETLAGKMADMQANGFRRFICVESANAMENAVVLQAGESHCLSVKISVERFQQKD
ncbi:MAG: D-hexose-6-phosphate mutarotase [Candidatus Obscuribacter sp.]|nr:D-hexose-6-phosphate mutarotase [Candidatus Obscuribacter sp.]